MQYFGLTEEQYQESFGKEFSAFFDQLMIDEGGFLTGDQAKKFKDPGGATKFGISLKFLQGCGVNVADINNDGEVIGNYRWVPKTPAYQGILGDGYVTTYIPEEPAHWERIGSAMLQLQAPKISKDAAMLIPFTKAWRVDKERKAMDERLRAERIARLQSDDGQRELAIRYKEGDPGVRIQKFTTHIKDYNAMSSGNGYDWWDEEKFATYEDGKMVSLRTMYEQFVDRKTGRHEC